MPPLPDLTNNLPSITGEALDSASIRVLEDHGRELAPGVSWRRLRLGFTTESSETVGLAFNLLRLEPGAAAELAPTPAARVAHLMHFPDIENAYWQTCWAAGAIRGGRGTRESRLYLDLTPIFYEQRPDQPTLLAALREANRATEPPTTEDSPLQAFKPRYVAQEQDNFAAVRYLPAVKPTALVQDDPTVLAATNAGYFLNFPEEYDDGFSALHLPVGGHASSGELLVPPWIRRPGVAGNADGGLRSAFFGPDDLELRLPGGDPIALHCYQRGGELNGAVVRHFDRWDHALPRQNVQLIFDGRALVEVASRPGLATAPKGGAIVILTDGDAERALKADRLDIAIALRGATPRWMICAGPFLVRDGKANAVDTLLAPENAGEFHPDGPPPTRFPYDADKTAAPRTSLGTAPDGALLLVVVDGRNRDHSVGLTLHGLALLMETLGARDAINLDGGGSSVLALRDLKPEEKLRPELEEGVTGIPSDGGAQQRVVPMIIAVKRR